MAKSTTVSSGGSAHKAQQDVALQAKRRELLELRIRWKIADEAVRRSSQERKDFKASIDALAAELKGGSSEQHPET